MKYKEFLHRYKQYREKQTPDIRDKLPRAACASPSKPICFSMNRYRIAAAASALALIIVAALGIYFWPDRIEAIGSSSWTISEISSSPDSSQISVINQIPSWYAPGALSVSPFLYENSGLKDTDGFNGYVNARFLNLSSRYDNPGHESCSGVYYDTQTQSIFCVTHVIRNILMSDGVCGEETKIGVHFYEPTLGKAVFTLQGMSGNPSYCMDLNTGEYKKLPVSLYQSVYHAGGPEEKLSGAPYFVTMNPRKNSHVDDILLLNLETAEVTNILKNSAGKYIWDAMDDARLSPGGKYVYYTKMSGDAIADNGRQRTMVIYSVETGESREFQGEIIHALPDDSKLVVRTDDGVNVVTCATGESISLEEAADLPAQYGFLIGRAERYVEECQQLTVENLRTGEEKLVSDSYVYAYAFSPDSRYLYYYSRGRETIACREIATGKEFQITVDPQFLKATEEGENSGKQVFFYAYFDEENNTLLLGYQCTENARQDPEQVRQERENDPAVQLQHLKQNGQFNCISDIAHWLEKYPEELIAYEGDGFLFLDYTSLYNPGGIQTFVALEDYRTNRFINIIHKGTRLNCPFETWEKEKELPAGEQATVRELLERLDVPIYVAPLDYTAYMVNGKVDWKWMEEQIIGGGLILDMADNLKSYVVSGSEWIGDRRSLGSDETDISFMKDLLYEFFYESPSMGDLLPYRYVLADEFDNICDSAVYTVSFSPELNGDLLFGMRDGQYFIYYSGRMREINENDYIYWTDRLKVREEKSRLES